MGQSTEELTRDIEGTRRNLAGDLDALQDRVSPQAIMDRRKAAARSRVQRMRDRVMGSAHSARDSARSGAGSATSSISGMADSARDTAHGATDTAQQQVQGSPLAAGLVAFGAGMVVAAMLPASDKEAQAAHLTVEAAKDAAGPMADKARSMGQDMAKSAGQNMATSAMQAATEVRETATDAAAQVKDEGASSAQHVRSDAQRG